MHVTLKGAWVISMLGWVLVLALQVWQIARPPQQALLLQFAEVLGRKEATSLLLQAGNRELQQRLGACLQTQEKPK